ncbi:hypothetical protein ASG22_19665 [Chryseobacterium sp. Leaf405]|uniref:hypothetical protein n=1 Tax=Chryseobacterium sp. Leaf405 TaxID=1736367 RepID=UPI0006FD29D6|nr:hypothetical protein [Chryseobacterium sp. Leaf405]KQT30915.1 hypothetical protein ASG22_19665 [Chryseobacterium sp. Leaf405]
MKKLIFSVCILLGHLCFSQIATKKFNSFQNRYEYFDSNGNMIGYEKYNSFSKQWEYYTTNNTSQSRQPTQYRDPQQLDISALGNAMTAKQNNYNYNVQQLQNAVNTISDQIKNLDLSYEQRKLIYDTFQQNCVNEINRTRINYSSANETNRVIQWLYDSLNTIIKNVTSTYVSKNETSEPTNPTKQVKTYTGEQEVFTNSPIYDKPENGKQTGYSINNKVIVIEKYNDSTYKVQSGYFEGYMWVGHFKN